MNNKIRNAIMPLALSGAFLAANVSSAFADSQGPVLAQAVPAAACQKQGRPAGPPPSMMDRMQQALNLDQKQVDEIKTIKIQARSKAKPIMRDLERNRFEFKQATTADNYDQKQIDKFTQAQGDDIGQLMSLKAKTVNMIKSVLTDDQKVKFSRMAKKFKGKNKMRIE